MNTIIKSCLNELEISRTEALRYAGVKGEADEATEELLDNALKLLGEMTVPKAVYCKVSVRYTEDGLYLGDDFLKSKGLEKFLQGAESAWILAATAGIEADRLITRYSMVSPSLALMIDSAAAAVVEAFCNKLCAELFKVRKCERFSPGYGDFDIKYQEKIISLLQAGINIGVGMTDSLMLAPSKSVTAIVPERQ